MVRQAIETGQHGRVVATAASAAPSMATPANAAVSTAGAP